MVNYKYAELYTQDSIDKQVKIEYDGGTITNEELFSESVELTESLCSEPELRFGCCEASVLKFKVANIMIPLSGKWLNVSETLAGNTDEPFVFGKYKVYSDKPTADRRYRDIVAYDAMYDINNTNVADWYNELLLVEKSTVTLKEFRTRFVEYFGLEQEEVDLINDDMIVERTIEPSEISGHDVLTAICEINGCFGHIGRNGKLKYIVLPKEIQGLYPSDNLYPADDLYPREPKSSQIGKGLYISAKYEDFITKSITKLQIRQEENDIGCIVGSGDNCYIVEDNFLVYGKSAKELQVIADNLLEVINGVTYRPFEADAKGNPCLEVGDPVRLTTKYELIESYILRRTLKGIQALRDSYTADGVEEYSEKVNSVNKSIIQLKGKTNVLERTVEETKSTITDVEKGLQSQITQTAEEIRTDVSKTYETKSDAKSMKQDLQSSISQTAEQIRSDVSASYETKTSAETSYRELASSITQTAESIKSEVSATYETQSDSKSAYDELRSSIEQTAEQITTRVSKDSVVSEINQSAEGIKIRAELLELIGSMQMTGGYVHIATDESVANLIEFKRNGTVVEMGTDGFRTTEGTIENPTHQCVVQYNGVRLYKSGTAMIDLNGDTGVGGFRGGVLDGSDERMKNSVKDLDKQKSADFIYSLKPKSFRYNFEDDGIHHGFIAQSVNEMVDDDWLICKKVFPTDDGDTYYGLAYTELIADLVATVQLQNEQINALTKRITALEGK